MAEAEFEVQGSVSRLDSAFANFLCRKASLDGIDLKQLKSLLVNLSQQQSQGHSCMAINATDKNLLLASGLASDSTTDSKLTLPVIIEEDRCYLQRYWYYEKRLAQQIQALARTEYALENLQTLLSQYFPENSGEMDWQREAAKQALQHGLCIITGGPGTGKTTTVCKILALLQSLSDTSLSIALTAPTGKAAMRLQETITENLARLNCDQALKSRVPQVAMTIHRLLEAKPPTPYFKHDADNPLIYDVVIVDEASMVDLALMSKLVDALKPTARLILLGDKDQLASVESGAVLADLIAALPERTVELKHSYRFNLVIQQLAEAVNQQNAELAWQTMSSQQTNIRLIQEHIVVDYILKKYAEYVDLVNIKANFGEIYAVFNCFQVLCSNRHGKHGAVSLSQLIERKLFKHTPQHGGAWYGGRPVMILQNNAQLGLYNGDIGICLADDTADANLKVFFQRPDGSMKTYLPSRLPACETVFAMTIHKSQGSEFEEVFIILPEEVNPVLSKELLYTAITRAKSVVNLCTSKPIFTVTVNSTMIRLSGLARKLATHN